jgi:ParB-like nuclease family protein
MREPSVFIGTINWQAFCTSSIKIIASHRRVKFSGCDWITSESIEAALTAHLFEDVLIPQTSQSHHNERIASLINMIQCGISLDHIHVHIHKNTVKLYDGSHRLRAYEYLNMLDDIPCIVTGNKALISPYINTRHTIISSG